MPFKAAQIPWNKGTKQSAETLKAKRKAYYLANKDIIIKKVTDNRLKKVDYYKENIKWYTLKTKYNLSKEQHEALYLKQNGLCAICKRNKRLIVDHCHSTGKVRGLLCFGCNRDMYILDNPLHLEAARKYKNESF